MQESATMMAELTEPQFERISRLVREVCGINLHNGKKELVKARLAKRLRQLGMRDYQEYLDYLHAEGAGEELTPMLDALSTNLTSFFREPRHFECLANSLRIRSQDKGSRRLRIWSAGCSSGEEPYSIALTMLETLGDLSPWDARILATDLSTRVLDRARQGIYPADRVAAVPPGLRGRGFECIAVKPQKLFRIESPVQSLVSFARLNLMDQWPMRGPFDAIFCRNVMIYFDKPTQAHLVERFWELLANGGLFFIGHSESLAGVRHRFRYVEPTIYEKI